MFDKLEEGTFTQQAKKAGMEVQEFANMVLKSPNNYTEKTRKRAQFAKNMANLGNKKKKERKDKKNKVSFHFMPDGKKMSGKTHNKNSEEIY